jgi:ABC-2 type transport system ATP-binding protein
VRLSRGNDALADVVRALDAEGIAIADFQLHAPSLDDVFLARTGKQLVSEQDPDEQAAERATESMAS